ncbi:hypothetical protein GLYMA_01G018200v4 [Glycine max]|nr:hypothetical protein GLYMA_01G018200v4 [Glycine max]KAH1161182.1 hypothetical protein GYH30_000184 [Glycine max]
MVQTKPSLSSNRTILSNGHATCNDLPDLDFSSPGNTNKHVVVVMDGMTEFTKDTLQWALDNVVTAGCILTLLGVMPWLNIPHLIKGTKISMPKRYHATFS